MAKSKDSQKTVKKEALLTPKEKKAAKKAGKKKYDQTRLSHLILRNNCFM